MNAHSHESAHSTKPAKQFRRAVLRGLGVVLPPLLTILFFLWIWNSVQSFVLVPLESGARLAITSFKMRDVHEFEPPNTPLVTQDDGLYFEKDGERYVRLATGDWIREEIYDRVNLDPGEVPPRTAEGYINRYVDMVYLRRKIVVPMFLIVFVLVLYLLGRFIAARMGRMMWNVVERFIHQLPLIRTVYGSVKQVTDFVFSERDIEFNRVVAVEYPSKGIWSLGFVTGESMLDIRSAANEPVLTVLIPTSPMPATGYTITVRKSATVDLNISIDQAFQFIVSCGVVVPNIQRHVNGVPMTLSSGTARLEHAGSQDEDGRSQVAS